MIEIKEIGSKDLKSNLFSFSPSALQFIPLEKSLQKLKKKYENVFDHLKSFDGFAFPSSDFVTHYEDMKNKYPLIQIGNVNDEGWLIDETQDFEYLPSFYSKKKSKYFLTDRFMLLSLTGGNDLNCDISSLFLNDFPAFLNQRVSALRPKRNDPNLLLYAFALTKHDVFKVQWFGKGGIQKNTISTERKRTYLPLIKEKKVIRFIASLVDAILRKEKEIVRKRYTINRLIEEELHTNQKSTNFHYSFPKYSEVIKNRRIDTGVYTDEFKKIDFLIKNYNRGCFFIDDKKIKGGKTPTKRYISDKLELDYLWVTPTNISDFGTYLPKDRINCPAHNLNENAMLIINRTSKGGKGEYVGISFYYEYESLGTGQHNQGIYKITDYPKSQLLFMVSFMNCNLMRKYCAGLSSGSKMKEIKSNHVLSIPFPKFQANLIKKINELYFKKPSTSYSKISNADIFLEIDNKWNKSAGIVQLKESATIIKQKLSELINDIICDNKITINYLSQTSLY